MSALNPVLTIGAQIAEVFQIHQKTPRGEALERAVELLEKVGIPEAASRSASYPHQLSGGQRQRAMIAMALACKPSLLIADEPTTALDVTTQAQILDLIADIRNEMGMAVLFISHNLAVVSNLADAVAVMYAGRIVETGPPRDLFEKPAHPYTQGLLATLPRIGDARDRLPTIGGRVPDLGQLPAGCRFSDRCPLGDDACRQDDPALIPVGSAHQAACFKVTP